MGQKLGQHFLRDQATLARIAAVVTRTAPGLIVEIGPGRGALTAMLLESGARVLAIEIDPRLATGLKERFQNNPRLEVLKADVLETDLAPFGPATVAGNLPYYITSPIVDRVLQLGPRLREAVFLVQEEVADRLTAAPGTRDYGYLTVRTRLVAETEKLFRVPSSAFRPAPKVHSALVRLTPHPGPPAGDLAALLDFIGLAFRHKRKTLRNNLSGAYDRARVSALAEASLRAEQLSVEQFRDLYERLRSSGGPVY